MFKVFGFLLKFKNTSKKAFDSLGKSLKDTDKIGEKVSKQFVGMKKGISKGLESLGNASRRSQNKIAEFASSSGKVLGAFSENFGGAIGMIREALTGRKGIIGISGLAGAALGYVGLALEKVNKRIIAQTGLTGKAAKEYEDITKRLVHEIGASFNQVGGVMTTLASRQRGATKDTQELAESIIRTARITGMSATEIAQGIEQVSRQTQMSGDSVKGFMNGLIEVGQASRASIQEMVSFGSSSLNLISKLPEAAQANALKSFAVVKGILAEARIESDEIANMLASSLDLTTGTGRKLKGLASRAGAGVGEAFSEALRSGNMQDALQYLVEGIRTISPDERREIGESLQRTFGIGIQDMSKLASVSNEKMAEIRKSFQTGFLNPDDLDKKDKDTRTVMGKFFDALNKLGVALAPIATKIIEFLTVAVEKLTEFINWFDALDLGWFSDFAKYLGTTNIGMSALIGLVAVLATVLGPIVVIGLAIASAFVLAKDGFSAIGDAVMWVWGGLKDMFSWLSEAIPRVLGKMLGTIKDIFHTITFGLFEATDGDMGSGSAPTSAPKKFARGGLIMPNNHGINATVAEGGRPEIIANPEMMRKIIGTDDIVNTMWETARYMVNELKNSEVIVSSPAFKAPKGSYGDSYNRSIPITESW